MQKKVIFSALLDLALTMGSCSSDQPLGAEQNRLEKGDPTYTAFSIRMNKSTSRAALDDDNADPVEQTISDINIYVFSGGVLEVQATPEINEYVTVPVAVSTGEKIIYAVSTDLLNGENALTFTEETTLLKDFEATLFNSLAEKIAESDAFTMIGSTRAVITKCTEAEAQANPIKIEVDRAATKVQVKYGNNVEVRPTINATFAEASFALAQQARQMYVKRGNLYTPTGTKVKDNGTYPGFVGIPNDYATATNYFIDAVDAYDPAYDKNKYAAECVVESPVTGNVTFALVRLRCTPTGKLYGNKNLPSDKSFWVAARNDAKTATWIFASDEEYKLVYFASENDAKSFITDNKLGSDYKAYKYDKGYAYYRVNIIHNVNVSEDGEAVETPLTEKYRMERNNYYRANITAIKALGAPTGPGVVPTDPDTPIEQDSWLAAEIDTKPWTMHERDYELQ